MLCQFLLYNEVDQLYVCVCVCVYIYIYIYPFPLESSSHYPPPHPTHLGHQRAPNRASYASQQVPTSFPFTHNSVHVSPNLPILLNLLCHMSILYICISISALEIGSSVPYYFIFSQIPYICINIMSVLSPSTIVQHQINLLCFYLKDKLSFMARRQIFLGFTQCI